MKIIKLEIPYWCKNKTDLKYHQEVCCNCGKEQQYYQEGDGKYIHNLCLKWQKIIRTAQEE